MPGVQFCMVAAKSYKYMNLQHLTVVSFQSTMSNYEVCTHKGIPFFKPGPGHFFMPAEASQNLRGSRSLRIHRQSSADYEIGSTGLLKGGGSLPRDESTNCGVEHAVTVRVIATPTTVAMPRRNVVFFS